MDRLTLEDARRDTAGSLEIQLCADARLAVIRFAPETTLTAKHGVVMVDALAGLVGGPGEPFALLADTLGVCGTDAEYRTVTGAFFRRHLDTAHVAVLNLNPFIRVVAEMFRVAIGLKLKAFDDEAAARSWLRSKGIAA